MSPRYKRSIIDIESQPADVGLHVRVEDDGRVWVGFFAEDGKSGLLSLDKILDSVPEGSLTRAALMAWGSDRRKQAAAVAG